MAFRRLWPEDAGRLAAHMRRLDDESRRFRFGRAVSDEFLDRYCAETDWLHSILIGYEPDGELRGVGDADPELGTPSQLCWFRKEDAA